MRAKAPGHDALEVARPAPGEGHLLDRREVEVEDLEQVAEGLRMLGRDLN